MLSKAQKEYFNHPSTHPAKNAGFAQDEHFFRAASKHSMTKNNYLRNMSDLAKQRPRLAPIR
jgi:hypothetical protein